MSEAIVEQEHCWLLASETNVSGKLFRERLVADLDKLFGEHVHLWLGNGDICFNLGNKTGVVVVSDIRKNHILLMFHMYFPERKTCSIVLDRRSNAGSILLQAFGSLYMFQESGCHIELIDMPDYETVDGAFKFVQPSSLSVHEKDLNDTLKIARSCGREGVFLRQIGLATLKTTPKLADTVFDPIPLVTPELVHRVDW